MARISTITIRPAELTAAAVNEPDMAEAMLSPAKIRVMTSISTAPSGVLITLTIEPAVPSPLPTFCFSASP